MTEIQKVMKEFRQRHKLSMSKAGGILGIKPMTISRWESGKPYRDYSLWNLIDKIKEYEEGEQK